MMFDDLDAFLSWYLNNRHIAPPSDLSLHVYNGLHAAVVYRQPPYQVEIYIVDPNTEVPDHTHPNVDSYEVFLCGDVYFRREGREITTLESVKNVNPDGTQQLLGSVIRIRPNDSHGATIGNRGGMFMSVQKWLNGSNPTSVGKDWIDTETKATFNKDIIR